MPNKNSAPDAPSTPVKASKTKLSTLNALEVDSPLVSSEENATVAPSRMVGSYLTVDARMDDGPITFKFSTKETSGPKFADIVDSSGESGARKTDIPLDYLTTAMGFTLLISYTGTVQGQAAASLVKEVAIEFYPASESEDLAPRLLHEKTFQNTPTYDMHDHTGNETVLVPVPPLAKEGDKVYCTAVTEQDVVPYTFYTVVYGHELTKEEAVAGHVLRFFISRGWLARRKPWQSITLQSAWITSGLEAEPPADIDPHLETRLPANALEIQRRRTVALIVDHRLELKPPHLRQSVFCNKEWYLNPELTKEGGDVEVPTLDTYAGDQVCFYMGDPAKPLGCVTAANDGDRPSAELSPCDIACVFNKKMTLSYTVQFPNADGPQKSPAQAVNVSVPQFSRSGIEEGTNGTVDLTTFPGDATALVPVWAYAKCSDSCWMWITGTDKNGGAYRFDILTGAPVTEYWKTHGVASSVPRAELKKLADCSDFELHFAASFCQSPDLASAHVFPVQTFTVEQEPLVLPAPKVSEAVGSTLTAHNGRNGVHVEVNYGGNHPQHSISVCWQRADGTCWPLTSKPGSATGAVIFALPSEAVIQGMDETVAITYTVTTACKVQTSLPLNLNITLPTRLETPKILQATPSPDAPDAILDLGTFELDADSREDTMWFLRAGQKCWLRANGTKEDGAAYSFVVYAARTITKEEEKAGVAGPVLRSELDKLKDNTNLTFTFSVATGGGIKENVVCPSRVLTLRARFDDLTTFDNNNWNHWVRGPAAADPRDLVITPEDDNWCLYYWTYTNKSQGIFLQRNYSGLEADRDYVFSISIRRINSAPSVPQVSLLVDGKTLAGPAQIESQRWQTMSGIFRATGEPMLLALYNHVATGQGNDYAIDNIRVKRV